MKKRANYDKSFKERAVKLSYDRGSVSQAAKELGISDSSLGKWRKDFETYGENSFPVFDVIFSIQIVSLLLNLFHCSIDSSTPLIVFVLF